MTFTTNGYVALNDIATQIKTTRRWFRCFLVPRGGIDQSWGCL